MVQRIERVSRVKKVETKSTFARRADYRRNGKNFAQELRKAKDALENEEDTSEISEAYNLDIQRATQSLFYGSRFDLGAIGGMRL